jgi:hypothetical protein
VEGYPITRQGKILTRMIELKENETDPYLRGLRERAEATLIARPLEIAEAWSDYENEFAEDREEMAADIKRRYRTEAAI